MIYTYLFYRPEDGLTKIGRTKSPQQRFSTLGGHKNLKVIALILGDMERSLHDYHKTERATGEWFSLSEAVRENYKNDYGVQELPEGNSTNHKKIFLEVTKIHKDRVSRLAKKAGGTIKEITRAILETSLPQFEEGGDYELKQVGVSPQRKSKEAGK